MAVKASHPVNTLLAGLAGELVKTLVNILENTNFRHAQHVDMN